ncbi:MAG TPA: hypothetical protein VFS27_06155 [Blastocatellia bacterium]|jgi:hypothetical protein|nr:hypothetical protein [Blastocatellia bacterium]
MKVRICFVALCLLVFYCAAAYGQTAEWEYKQLGSPSDELLNHYAKNGWEVVAAAGGQFYYVVLKRSRSHPLFGTKTPETPSLQPAPPPQKPTCKLTLAQAPAIRGLRLGMTSDELFTIFPANEREEFDRAQKLKSAELPPNYGSAFFQFVPSNYATKDRFTGIYQLNFWLFDKKVVSIVAYYGSAPQFDRPGQLMEIITKQFDLPEFKDWPNYNEYSGIPSLPCEGFTFQVDANNATGGSFTITLTDPAYKKIVEDRKQADRAKKREGFKL